MSYDYSLVKGGLVNDLDAFAENAMSETIGEIEAVKDRIAEIFPSIVWQPYCIPATDELGSVFGKDELAEFHLLIEADAQVRMITMSYTGRETVELTANKLGLIVIDEQSMEIFDG